MDHARTSEDRSRGLSPDDHEMLERGFVVYDALYAWLKYVRDEKHDWNPQKLAGVQ